MPSIIQTQAAAIKSDTRRSANSIYQASDPLYPLNFINQKVPNKVVISNRVASILPELASLQVENFYWIIGTYHAGQFLAIDFRYIAKGTPTTVEYSSPLSFNQELKELSKKGLDFSLTPLHNHPNVVHSCLSNDGFYFTYRNEIRNFLTGLWPSISDKLSPTYSFSEFEYDLVKTLEKIATSSDPKKFSTDPLIKLALQIVSESSVSLSAADARLGASFQLLLANPSMRKGEVLAYPISIDKTDPDFPFFIPEIKLIPIIREAKSDTSTRAIIKEFQKKLELVSVDINNLWQPYMETEQSLNRVFPRQDSIRQEYLRLLQD